MTPADITATLVSARNILLNDRTNQHILPSLEGVLASVDLIPVPYTQAILRRCLSQVIGHIRTAHFTEAGIILNLLHNLPLDDVSRVSWDIDYFISTELATFLEHYDQIPGATEIVLRVCAELSRAYLAENDGQTPSE